MTQRFIDDLQAAGVHPAAQKFYRDHHPYFDSDIDELIRLKVQTSADGFVTTEKDAVNLGSRIARLEPVAVAQVTMDLGDPAGALDTILLAISDRKRQT